VIPVAVVTGAARGIGAATVRTLSIAGWAVVATDLAGPEPGLRYELATKDDLEAVVASCANPSAVLPLVVDVRQQDDVDAAVEAAVEHFGRLDAALAVAGVIIGGMPTWETSDDEYRRLFDINTTGVWRLARAAIPSMLDVPQPRQGRFIAVASAAAHRGLPSLGVYGAAKHAVVGLVRGLAADLRGTGITANAVSPGSTDTMMLEESARIYGLSSAEHFAPQHLLERLLHPEEIAHLLAWLAGPESSGITGTVIAVDAGLTV
jgi:SDR family mycofactocin-dependent oxidoreductase